MRRIFSSILSVIVLVSGLLIAPLAPVASALGVLSNTLVSASPTGNPGDLSSAANYITPDGRYVAFSSAADNLVSGVSPANGETQTYLSDSTTGNLVVVSRNSSGDLANGSTRTVGISDNGRFVLLASTATNLDNSSIDPGVEGLYLSDRQLDTTQRICPNLGGAVIGKYPMSADGSLIVYGNCLYNRLTDTTTTLSDGGSVLNISGSNVSSGSNISKDGRYINFQVDNKLNRYDLLTDQLTTHSISWPYNTAVFSPDGTQAAYFLRASWLLIQSLDTGINTPILYIENYEYDDASHDLLSFSDDNHYLSFGVPGASQQTPGSSQLFPGASQLMDDLYVTETVRHGQLILARAGVEKSSRAQLNSDGSRIVYVSHPVDGTPNQVWLANIGNPPSDTTAPTVTGTPDTQPDSGSWYNHNVTINWSATDPDSDATTPGQTVASTEGADVTYTSDPSCDPTGNCATGSLELKIDKTAPLLGVPTWTANPVILGNNTSFGIPASDATSGVAAGEYFVGTDPGVGNATSLTWDGTNLNSVAFGSNLTPGVYNLCIRAKDVAGNWSATQTAYLVVYNPSGPGYIVGQQNLRPGVDDTLPWISTSSKDFANFGFNVKFTSTGTVDPSSDFSFDYTEKGTCGHPNTPACHSFVLTATSFDWFAVSGTNNSQGYFQGTATLNINGTPQTVVFRVEAKDGDLFTPKQQDSFVLKVYPQGSDPQTATPLYQVSADFTPNTGNASGGVQVKK